MSLSKWGLLTGDKGYNFPQNYVAITRNQLFWPSVWFTIEYTIIVTVLLIGLGLGLALLVQATTRWAGFLRTAFLLPGVARPRRRVPPRLRLLFAQHRPGQSAARGDRPHPRSRRFPQHVAQRLAVDDVPGGVEICRLLHAGAGGRPAGHPRRSLRGRIARWRHRWQSFRYLTLPLLRPSLSLATILCITGSLLAFDQFFILTKGAPDNTTVTAVQVIYREAFQRQNLGTAAALSIIVLLVLVAINALQFRFLRGTEQD